MSWLLISDRLGIGLRKVFTRLGLGRPPIIGAWMVSEMVVEGSSILHRRSEATIIMWGPSILSWILGFVIVSTIVVITVIEG